MKRMIYVILLGVSFCSCKKSEFLNAKPDQVLIVPSTIKDFQGILDNNLTLNGTQTGLMPSLGEVGADNYIVFNWLPVPFISTLKNLYTWKDDIYSTPTYSINDWQFSYNSVFYCNLALEGVSKIKPTPEQQNEFNNIKGSALFYRSLTFYGLTQVYSPYYKKSDDNNVYGIPLRLTADINEEVNRAKIQETYNRIIEDLLLAKDLLPDLPLGGFKTRPSKCATFGLLARIYLTIGDYEKAVEYSNNALKVYNQLIDYNSSSINYSGYFSISRYNKEVIFHSTLSSGAVFLLGLPSMSKIDPILYQSYSDNDLRKTAFFRADQTFRGSYDGSLINFCGIATDELYLIRAEGNARLGNIEVAMTDLNTLMKTRWKNSVPYPEFTASSKEDAISKILVERRKELLFRGLRWSDIRRLNRDGAGIKITRVVDGVTYVLEPDSKHYTCLIPPDVMGFNPDWPQNPR